ncbi:hypothetical protein HOK021_37370 [Streptomyces hygroscopicus]|nr:hypothetical protein HOK021_37370 [Streptomyces hygroscopicus]
MHREDTGSDERALRIPLTSIEINNDVHPEPLLPPSHPSSPSYNGSRCCARESAPSEDYAGWDAPRSATGERRPATDGAPAPGGDGQPCLPVGQSVLMLHSWGDDLTSMPSRRSDSTPGRRAETMAEAPGEDSKE